MNLSALNELKERIENIIFAGTALIGEDFKLKRAYENFLPMADLNPVFGKIKAAMEKVFASSKESVNENLLDALSLIDAVLYTQAEPVLSEEELSPVKKNEFYCHSLECIDGLKPESRKEMYSWFYSSFYRNADDEEAVENIRKIIRYAKDFRLFPVLLRNFAFYQTNDKINDEEVLNSDFSFIEQLYVPPERKLFGKFFSRGNDVVFAYLLSLFGKENHLYEKTVKELNKFLGK